jgi:uncharacterized protein (TIGR02284 family)
MKTMRCLPISEKENLVGRLSRLAIACDEDSRRFERASREVSNEELSLLFSRYARRRAEFARELSEYIDRIEGRPSVGSSVVRVHRRGGHKNAAGRRDDGTILSDCEHAEGELRAMYEAILSADLPDELPMCLRRQSLAVSDVHDQMRKFCSALAWCAVPMAV